MPNYITLDFETTGINVLVDRPVQAAYCVHNSSGKNIANKSLYINPGMKIDPGASAIHGISQEKADQGISLTEFTEYWHKLIWKFQPVTILGYNIINFDYIILQRILAEYKEGKFKFPPVEKIVDVMFLAQRSFRTKKWPKLIEAVNRLGIIHDPNSFHDALADVQFTWKIFEKLVFQQK